MRFLTYGRDQDIIQLCKRIYILLMAYSPLGFYYSMILLDDVKIESIKEKFLLTSAQIILTTWLMSKKISVIPKSNDPSRQDKNFKSLELLQGRLCEERVERPPCLTLRPTLMMISS